MHDELLIDSKIQGLNRSALVNLMFNVVPALIVFPALGLSARWLDQRYPQTAEERLIEILGRTFEIMANPAGKRPLEALDEAFQTLANSIREAFHDISNQGQISPALYDRLNALLNLQHALEAANLECQNLASEIIALENTDIGDRFKLVAINGVETILLTLQDVARNRDELASTTRMQLLAAANHCERLIWLFGDMGKTYRLLSA